MINFWSNQKLFSSRKSDIYASESVFDTDTRTAENILYSPSQVKVCYKSMKKLSQRILSPVKDYKNPSKECKCQTPALQSQPPPDLFLPPSLLLFLSKMDEKLRGTLKKRGVKKKAAIYPLPHLLLFFYPSVHRVLFVEGCSHRLNLYFYSSHPLTLKKKSAICTESCTNTEERLLKHS